MRNKFNNTKKKLPCILAKVTHTSWWNKRLQINTVVWKQDLTKTFPSTNQDLFLAIIVQNTLAYVAFTDSLFNRGGIHPCNPFLFPLFNAARDSIFSPNILLFFYGNELKSWYYSIIQKLGERWSCWNLGEDISRHYNLLLICCYTISILIFCFYFYGINLTCDYIQHKKVHGYLLIIF